MNPSLRKLCCAGLMGGLSACAGTGGSDSPYYEAPPALTPLPARDAATRNDIAGCVVVSYTIQPDGSATDARILDSRPAGYFDARVLKAMEGIRFRSRAEPEASARVFTFVPPGSAMTADAAASLCMPVPQHLKTPSSSTRTGTP